jgi:hypothetical protein
MPALAPISDVHLFGDIQGVVDFDAKIANGAFDLSVTEKQLNCSQISGLSTDQYHLGSSKRMGSKECGIKPYHLLPLNQQAGVLAC